MTYQTPGVYVEEVPSAVRPIAGVGTSTAGFIGRTADNTVMPAREDGSGNYKKADAGKPVRITSWEDFKRNFGNGIQPGNKMLAHAVYGFFNNGGNACWVIRVTGLLPDTSAEPAKDEVKEALETMEAIDEIALVAVPMTNEIVEGDPQESRKRRVAIREMLLSHCEKMKDRFAVLDGELEVDGSFQAKGVYPNAAGEEMGRKSDYGAVYFPWIDVSGDGEYVPPCGHLAGICSRVDEERGVHKAPANETIRGALGVKYNLSKAQQAGLNPDGMNVIRQFNGTITVWGARTIGGDANTDLKYINVRRLLNFLRESIEEGTQWVVFEPNDNSLWQKIKRNISAFLTTVWLDGALFGDTAEQAFYVKCDESLNPPAVRDLGQVVTEIGVAIVKPAEFVVFRISQFEGAAV